MMKELRIHPNGAGDAPNAFNAGELATAGEFLRLLTPTAHATYKSPGSYALKHTAERWGRRHGLAPYVSNGALIAAAVVLGLPVAYGGGLNVAIGVSKRDVERLRSENEHPF